MFSGLSGASPHQLKTGADRAIEQCRPRRAEFFALPPLRRLGDDGCETRTKADGLESWSNSLSTQNHLIAILQKSAFFSRFE
jgi:hypothetical protein